MQQYLKKAQEVLQLEAQALIRASKLISEVEIKKLIEIYDYLSSVGGHLVFMGIGKSGLIGQKISSTFSSLGLPSFFLHPVEALHGDLGRFRKNDALVLLSKSGTTEEILKVLPYLDVESNLLIGLIGDKNSILAKKCGLLLDCSIEAEACINNQAPTTSSTLALAMGDAMAVVYELHSGLSREGFAVYHPGGILGKSLRMKVKDLMRPASVCPKVLETDTLQTAILEMTKFPVGGAVVLNKQDQLLGIMVEGDIRRTFASKKHGLETKMAEIMNRTPISIGPEDLAIEALRLMEERKSPITILPVVENNKFLGFIRLHDLLQEGFSSSQSRK